MPATNTSSISTSELRRRHRKTSAIRPPATAAATSTHAARSVGVGGTVPVAGAMNSMSIRGPETDAEGLPFPSVNSSAKTKLATLVSAADPKVIPRRRASPGAREGIVQLYRLPWLDRGIEPLSERKAGPLGKVVLSQPVPVLVRGRPLGLDGHREAIGHAPEDDEVRGEGMRPGREVRPGDLESIRHVRDGQVFFEVGEPEVSAQGPVGPCLTGRPGSRVVREELGDDDIPVFRGGL